VAVAPTLVARSQRSLSERAMLLPHPENRINIDCLVNTTRAIPQLGTTLALAYSHSFLRPEDL
jgi:hypothetical protein